MTARTAHARSAIDSQLTGNSLPTAFHLKDHPPRSDIRRMKDPALAIPYLILWAAMMRALLVRAQILPATCNRCGRPYERRELGETVCSCGRA